MSKKRRINYNKISNQETAVDTAVEHISLSTESQRTSALERIPQTPDTSDVDATVSTAHLYRTIVGNLNVRKGPGKGFDVYKGEGENFDQCGRLKKGVDIYISETTVDGVGNIWGLADYGYICLEDAERGLTFAEPM